MLLIGHKKNRSFLDSLAKKQFLPQSYLFTGPRELGKKLVACEFARKLMGEENFEQTSHPDLLILEPLHEKEKGKVKRKRISVEAIREARLFLSRYPAQGKRRVLLIDEAEELSIGASNALLKILEEPNETSVIILITHRPGALPSTILSRVVNLSFDLVPEKELRDSFGKEGETVPDFFFSFGLPGLIVKALTEKETFTLHKEFLGKLFQISKLSLRERLVLAEHLAEDEETLIPLLEEWLTGLHFRLKERKNGTVTREFLLLLNRLQESISTLTRREGNPRLVLEKMLLSL